MNTQKQIDRMHKHLINALFEFEKADNIACTLSNRKLIDFHIDSAISTYMLRVQMPLEEAIEYLRGLSK